VPKHCRTLPDPCLGESRHLGSVSISSASSQNKNKKDDSVSLDSAAAACNSVHSLSVFFINIQCLLAHIAELCHHLEIHQPHVVCLQETWLDASHKEINVAGYRVCSRRDRHPGSNRGGVLTLERNDFNGLVHIANSEDEERSWHFLKLGVETLLLANWYRPGSSAFDGFSVLYAELAEYFNQVSGVLLVGDLNIHHKKWLKYSSCDTRIGSEMKTLCDFHGFAQLVKEPTRQEYLLDLAISDIAGAKASVLSYIADHKAVRIDVPIPVIKEVFTERTVWNLKTANWEGLKSDLQNVDWSILQRGTGEDALIVFMEILWNLLLKHITQKVITCKKSSHPWLNERCRASICKKNAAEGTEAFKDVQAECTKILLEERLKYVEALKIKLASLPRSSKQWWRINRELLNRKATLTSIPPLKDGADWLVDAKAKADVFARTFDSKCKLPPEVIDTPFFGNPEREMLDFVAFRTRDTKKLFKKIG